ncbi:MAG: hypothetical protein L6300_06485 [Syntrophaceae bacterium]|nr:hypothetical protein [Syntrophaceae bacterium]
MNTENIEIQRSLPAQFPLPKCELGDPPQAIGPLANRTLDMEAMANYYFSELGLDPATGLPLPETVRVLGLETIINIS